MTTYIGRREFVAVLFALVRLSSRPYGGGYAEHIRCMSIAFRSDRKNGSSSVLPCCIRNGERNATIGLPIAAASTRIRFRLGSALLRTLQVARTAEYQHCLSAHEMSIRKENSQSTRARRGRFTTAGPENTWKQSECQRRFEPDASIGFAYASGRLRAEVRYPP